MDQNEYLTSDLAEATALKYFTHKLLRIDKTERRAQFCFEKKKGTTECLIKEYRERVLLVEPYMFFQCLKELKDRLYND